MKNEQIEIDKKYAEIFKYARGKEPNKNSGIVPEMDVVGLDTKKILCKAHLIGGDIFLIYGTGRIEMILGMKYRTLGHTIQIIKKTKFKLIDKGLRDEGRAKFGK